MENGKKIKELSERIIILEHTISELKSQLIDVNEKLRKSEEYKSHFFSNITNEIINPFASIIGLSQVIMQTEFKNQDAINSLLTLIHSEAFNLDLQLKNIFYAAELESGNLCLENNEIHIVQFMENVKDKFIPLFNKNDLTLEFAHDQLIKENTQYFHNDSVKLNMIITNFLNIILNYSPKSKKIQVSYYITENQLFIIFHIIKSEVVIKYLKYLYKKVLNSTNLPTVKIYSHALALSVTKSIIDLMGGEIEFLEQKPVIKIKIPELKGEIIGYAENGDGIYF